MPKKEVLAMKPVKLVSPPSPAPAPAPLTEEKAYAFPTKSRCPRCRSLNTTRRSQKEATQYRRCQQAVCRHKYTVTGTQV